MAINLNDNVQTSAPKAIDNRHGKFVSGVWTPYASVTEANSLLAGAYRHKGLTVIVDDGTGSTLEYWYKDGIADVNLVLKNVGGSGSFSGNLFS